MITPPLRAAELSPEALECFLWFTSLDSPDVREAPFARYTDAQWWRGCGTGSRQVEKYGFILEEAGQKTFKVLSPEWEILSLEKTGPGTVEPDRVNWRKADFGKYCRQLTGKLRESKKEEHSFGGFWDRHTERLSHPAEILGVSFAAWRRGLPDAAQGLFDEAVRVWKSQRNRGEKAATFRGQLELDFGHAAMWRAVLACNGGDWNEIRHLAPRRELLRKFDSIIRQFPSSPHVRRAGEIREILKRMVAEDAAHPVIADEALEALPVEEQVEELIFRLRDQNGRQDGQPGGYDIFAFQKTGHTAAHRLESLGLEAVPGLIAALSDERFSRSVWFRRDFYYSHRILTIGDCALVIIRRIARQDFYVAGEMSPEERRKATQEAVESWWAGVRQNGLRQSLINGISSGNIDPVPLCLPLEALDADAVMPALLAGAARAEFPWLKGLFYQCMTASSDPRGAEFVLREMRGEESVPVRLRAVRALMPVKRQEALEVLLTEWRDYRPEMEEERHFMRGLFWEMAELLLSSRTPDGIAALGFQWEKRTAEQRTEICQVLARGVTRCGSFDAPVEEGSEAPAGTAAAAEKVLVRALEDTRVRTDISGSFDGWRFSRPTVATVANWALHRIKPAEYAFSNEASARQREHERIAALNVWRKSHG